MAATLFLMVGLPAAGKTTYARALAAELVGWRAVFEEPDAAELAGGTVSDPPAPWSSWRAWAEGRWPSL